MKKIAGLFLAVMLSHCSIAQTYVAMAKSANSKVWGYINLQGEFVLPPQFRKSSSFSKEGLALVKKPTNNEFSFVDLKGNFLVLQVDNFKMIKSFEDGMAAIRPEEFWGYLNTKGDLAIDAKYNSITHFNDGFAVVQSGEKYFVLNKQGEETPIDIPDLRGVRSFSEGLAPYHTISKVFGYIGTDGEIAIPAQFVSVGYFTNGLAWAKVNDGVVGYIDKTGEWVITPQFEAAKDFESVDGPARVKKNEQWCYVNRAGEIMYVNDAEIWGDFHEGLCMGKKNGEYGFYNARGEWVIEPQFEGVRDFKNGYAAAKKDKKWGIIDKTGNWVVAPAFEGIKDVELVE